MLILHNYLGEWMKQYQIVIIGGGYGGLRALDILAKNENFYITLIDQNPYHYMQAEVYEFIANKVDMSAMMIDLPSYCESYKNVYFHCEAAESIDTNEQYVNTTTTSIKYDYLIIATGSRTYFPDFIKGLREFSSGIKTLPMALHFKQEFEKALYNRIESQKMGCDVKPFNIVIGGAGLSGVEIAAEMAAYANSFYKNGNFGCRGIDVYLIDAYESILYGLDPYLIEKSHKRLEKLGVHIWHNNRIKEVKEKKIILDDDGELEFEFMIFTGGICASSLSKKLPFELNAKSHIIVESDLSIKNHPNIFAIGDVAYIADKNNRAYPPTAQLAERSGEHAAAMIKADIAKTSRYDFSFKNDGILIALGGEYGAGMLYNSIKVSGYLSYKIKKFIFEIYKKPLRNRSKIGKSRA